MGFPFPRFRRKKLKDAVDKKQVETIVQQELSPYVKQGELREQLIKIDNEKKKREKLETLLKFIRKHPRVGERYLAKHPKVKEELKKYVLEMKGGTNEKG